MNQIQILIHQKLGELIDRHSDTLSCPKLLEGKEKKRWTRERKKKKTAQMWCASGFEHICVCAFVMAASELFLPQGHSANLLPRRPPMTLPCVNQHMCLSQWWLASYLQGALQRESCDWKKAAAGHERGPHGVLASAWSRPETPSTVIHARPAQPRRQRLNNTLPIHTHQPKPEGGKTQGQTNDMYL